MSYTHCSWSGRRLLGHIHQGHEWGHQWPMFNSSFSESTYTHIYIYIYVYIYIYMHVWGHVPRTHRDFPVSSHQLVRSPLPSAGGPAIPPSCRRQPSRAPPAPWGASARTGPCRCGAGTSASAACPFLESAVFWRGAYHLKIQAAQAIWQKRYGMRPTSSRPQATCVLVSFQNTWPPKSCPRGFKLQPTPSTKWAVLPQKIVAASLQKSEPNQNRHTCIRNTQGFSHPGVLRA